ncbi:MAG: hypothetical protein RIK87_07430 [Fuerstiella sp.]
MRSVFSESTPVVSVSSFLASRGFRVKSQASTGKTLLRRKEGWTREERQLLFDIFHSTALRMELLEFIEADKPVTSEHVLRLIESDGFSRGRNQFSSTFEWYVAELLVREFGAFSSAFGVRIADIKRNVDDGDPGDFDVLSVLRNMQLLYVETKTGRFGRKDVRKAVQRGLAIHSLATVMLVGRSVTSDRVRQVLSGYTHPRMSAVDRFIEISVKDLDESNVFRCLDCFFVPADSTSSDLESKIRTVLRVLAADVAEKNRITGLDADTYEKVGYTVHEFRI